MLHHLEANTLKLSFKSRGGGLIVQSLVKEYPDKREESILSVLDQFDGIWYLIPTLNAIRNFALY